MLLASLLFALVGGVLLAFGILVTNVVIVYASMAFAFVAFALVIVSALPRRRRRSYT